jgi:hypothetical protein
VGLKCLLEFLETAEDGFVHTAGALAALVVRDEVGNIDTGPAVAAERELDDLTEDGLRDDGDVAEVAAAAADLAERQAEGGAVEAEHGGRSAARKASWMRPPSTRLPQTGTDGTGVCRRGRRCR